MSDKISLRGLKTMLLDETLELLSNPHRRNILYVMEDANDNVFSYENITDRLTEESYISEKEEERFEVQMNHVHLPRLEDSGLIQHDKRSETIRYIEDEDVEELLEFVGKYE